MDFVESKNNGKTLYIVRAVIYQAFTVWQVQYIKHFFQQPHKVGLICPHLTDAESAV